MKVASIGDGNYDKQNEKGNAKIKTEYEMGEKGGIRNIKQAMGKGRKKKGERQREGESRKKRRKQEHQPRGNSGTEGDKREM